MPSPKTEKSPAFQFYPREWDTDMNVIPMTYEEEGVYFALCRLFWLHGWLPANLDDLRQLLKRQPPLKTMERWWARIGRCWIERDGKLYHPRLERERAKQALWKAEGARGGHAKWGTDSQDHHETRRQRLAAARAKGTHTTAEWVDMLRILGNACVRCQTPGDIVKDHIIPLYQGGDDSIDNLQPLCRRCSSSKGPEAIDFRGDAWTTRTPTPTTTRTPTETVGVACSSSSSSSSSASASAEEPKERALSLVTSPRVDLELSSGQIQAAVPGLVGAWNNIAGGQSPFVAVTVRSHPKATAALRAHPDIDWWAALFARVASSDFLRGLIAMADGRAFIADFFWCLDKADAIAAGRYDNRSKTSGNAAELAAALKDLA